MDKETKKEFNSLARMIKRGFDHVDNRFEKVENRLGNLEKNYVNLEQGQEDIKLRLDQVAYRFELEDLEKRVRKVELKLGLGRM